MDRCPRDQYLLYRVLEKYGLDYIGGSDGNGLFNVEMDLASFVEIVDVDCVVPVLWSGETVKVSVDLSRGVVILAVAPFKDWPGWIHESIEFVEPTKIGFYMDCTFADLEALPDLSQLK